MIHSPENDPDPSSPSDRGNCLLRFLTRVVGFMQLVRCGMLMALAACIAPLASAAPVTATTVATGLTLPAAIVRAGSELWVSDHTLGFCRLVNGGIDQNTCNLAAISPGQAVFKPTPLPDDPAAGIFYVPDNSSKSQGVWRLGYRNGFIAEQVLIAARFGLGGNRPTTVALDSAGNLYVGFRRTNSIVRITTPEAETQTVQTIGRAAGSAGPPAMAFAGSALYLAEAIGVTRINNPGTCNGGCTASAVAGTGVPSPTYLMADGGALYVADFASVYRFNPTVGCSSQIATGYSGISAVSVDTAASPATLYVAEDPSLGAQVFRAGIYASAFDANAVCSVTGGGGGPTVPTGATLAGTGLTLPAAIVQAGQDLWVSDHTLGFCKLVAGALDQNSCNLAAVSPGQAVFRPMPTSTDPSAGVFYVPDNSSKGQGVYRLTYSGGSIQGATLLGNNGPLRGNRPMAVALGPDGNLYVVLGRNNNIIRINNPDTAPVPQTIGSVSGRVGPPAIAFVGNSLYLAEGTGVTRVDNAVSCTSGCIARTVTTGVPVPTALTSDGSSLYIGDFSTVYRYLPSAPNTMAAPLAKGFSGVTAVGVVRSGDAASLLTGDDASAGNFAGTGKVWITPLAP